MRVLLAEELVSGRKLLLRISRLPKHKRAPEAYISPMREWVRGIVKDLGRAS